MVGSGSVVGTTSSSVGSMIGVSIAGLQAAINKDVIKSIRIGFVFIFLLKIS